jgi:hypothetical protein
MARADLSREAAETVFDDLGRAGLDAHLRVNHGGVPGHSVAIDVTSIADVGQLRLIANAVEHAHATLEVSSAIALVVR